MITTIVILAYVASVFMARWFNKLSYQKNGTIISWVIWLVPIANIGGMIYDLVVLNEHNRNWFTGKYW